MTTNYLAFTDNIGSILSVIDEEGEKVFDASYDAWGRQTVTLNSIGLRRGYSGHEMMPESGLINMNGRLYDPVIGSFLSCDNYVQMPDNSQNFNRYSYCLNNPLKYTDPSGEFAWFIPAIAAAIVGGTTNLIANWDNCDGFWQCVAAFCVGAGAGVAVASTGGTASIGTVIATSAISSAGVAATNSVIAQTGKNFEGLENVDWMNVGKNALIGAASGAASGAAGYWASNTSLSVNGVAVKSPLLRSAIVSPIAAGAGHVVGGTVGGLLEGNSLGDSFANSFAGIGTSMALGGVIGVTTTMVTCYAEGISPWTGNSLRTDIAPYYPPNDGALGEWTTKTLDQGTVIDRYGSETGRYASPVGVPYEQRSLPPNNTGEYNQYRVLIPFEVESSIVSPWFYQMGYGTQYRLPYSIDNLINKKVLLKISK